MNGNTAIMSFSERSSSQSESCLSRMSLLLVSIPASCTHNDYKHAGLTCFAIVRHALSLSSRVDRSHSDSVDSVRLQVLQHGVVGAA